MINIGKEDAEDIRKYGEYGNFFFFWNIAKTLTRSLRNTLIALKRYFSLSLIVCLGNPGGGKQVSNLINLIIPLIAGILLGYFLRNKKHLRLDKVIFWAIIVLIFSLGFSIGSNSKLLNSLPTVGVTAIIISVMTILFSMFFLKIARKAVKIE